MLTSNLVFMYQMHKRLDIIQTIGVKLYELQGKTYINGLPDQKSSIEAKGYEDGLQLKIGETYLMNPIHTKNPYSKTKYNATIVDIKDGWLKYTRQGMEMEWSTSVSSFISDLDNQENE